MLKIFYAKEARYDFGAGKKVTEPVLSKKENGRERSKLILFRRLVRDLVFFEMRHGFYKDGFHAEHSLKELLSNFSEEDIEHYVQKALEEDEYLKKICVQALRMQVTFEIRDDLLDIKNWEARSESIRSLMAWLGRIVDFGKGIKIFGYSLSYSRYISFLGSTLAKYLLWIYVALASARVSKYLFYTWVVLHKRYDHEALVREIKKKIKIEHL